MSKRKMLEKANIEASNEIFEIIRLLEAMIQLEQAENPTDTLLYITQEKCKKVFENIEKTRKILHIID